MIRIKLGKEIISIELGDANEYRHHTAIDYWRCNGCGLIYYKSSTICHKCDIPAQFCANPNAGEVLDAHYL